MLSYQPPANSSLRSAGLALTCVMADHDDVRIAFTGEIDISTASAFADAVADVLCTRSQRRVCVDLSGVRFLDSCGIKALLDCRRIADADGRALVVTATQPIVRRILQITGVFGLLSPQDAGEMPARRADRRPGR